MLVVVEWRWKAGLYEGKEEECTGNRLDEEDQWKRWMGSVERR